MIQGSGVSGEDARGNPMAGGTGVEVKAVTSWDTDEILATCRERGIGWIALIAEGGSGDFYRGLGFGVEEGDLPMMYQGGGEDAHR